jgi:formylglycine-generating enzyme required for sulfatase activity
MYKLFSAVILLVAFSNVFGQPSAGVSALDWAKKKCADIGFKAGTERFGNCVLQLSRNDEAVSTAPKQATPPVGARPQTPTPSGLKTFKDCDECPEMVVIPGGKFLMGSKADPFATTQPSTEEQPEHSVAIKSFSIGKYEVTQEQWYSVMGTMPSKFKGRTLPVEQISWEDAQLFLKELSKKTGKRYRLPTEAEWEYAARAGTSTEYSFRDNAIGIDQYAWYDGNARNTNPVGEKLPNSFGLFDMQGNVWEWTEDCWNLNYVNAPNDGSAWVTGDCSRRVLRGGSWGNITSNLRSAYRIAPFSAVFSDRYGFRVVRDN